jgi:hypothetical protein
MTKRITFAVLAAISVPGVALAQDPNVQKELLELKSRVDELEDMVAKTSERLGGRAPLQAYTAKSLDFGGHLSAFFTYMHGDNGQDTGHLATVLELYLRAQIDDRWSVFATPGFYLFSGGFLDNPATAPAGDPALTPIGTNDVGDSSTYLSRAYAQFKHGDSLQVQGGVIGSPHGTTNREYFLPARTIAAGSLHTRYFLENQLYPQVLLGVRGSGKLPVGEGTDAFEYDVYYGVDDRSPSDGRGGMRLAYLFGDLGLTVAANYGHGTREPSATALGGVAALQMPFTSQFGALRDYDFAGIDIDWRQGDLITKTEAYYSAEDGFEDQRAFSTEWTYFVTPEWGLSYRFDFYDQGSDIRLVAPPATVGLVDLGHATEHAVGICYNPNASVRLRLDYHHTLLPRSDETADFVNVSWSTSF